MITPDYVRTMARYNGWQNRSIFMAASTLDDTARDLDRGAFFGSIRKTLNHLYWGDRLWMSRFWSEVSAPDVTSIADSTEAFATWEELTAARRSLDDDIINWSLQVDQSDLAGSLSWHSGAMNRDFEKPKAICIIQLFNHQTHHRGQVHAMLTAAGARPDDTDLPFMPESV